jgi:adenylate cyclase
MSVFEWIKVHEGFFSGLVAIIAIIGITGAGTRLLWIRLRVLGPGVIKRSPWWMMAGGGVIAISLVMVVFLTPPPGDSELQQAQQTTNNVVSVAEFGARPAIAVLPFDNLSADPEQAFFADGLAEDLITRLSAWRAFPVIARNSSFQYRGGNLDLKRVSAELGARYLLEGSVRRAGDQIRVTAQLIDASTDQHVWAQTYDRALTDLFTLQDEISSTIAASLVDDFTRAEGERAQQRGTQSLEAWSLYQLGMQHANQYTLEDYGEARKLFAQAVESDPRFATAWGQLALATVMETQLGGGGAREGSVPTAFESARRAVALDSRDPTAHAGLSAAYLAAGDPRNGIDSAQRAVDLNPSMPEAWIWLSWAQVLAGNPQAAITAGEQAQRLNPQGYMVWIHENLSIAYWELGRYAEGLERARLLIATQPTYFTGYAYIAMNAVALGQIDEARAAIAEGRRVQPDLSLALIQNYFAISRPEFDARRNGALRAAGLE